MKRVTLTMCYNGVKGDFSEDLSYLFLYSVVAVLKLKHVVLGCDAPGRFGHLLNSALILTSMGCDVLPLAECSEPAMTWATNSIKGVGADAGFYLYEDPDDFCLRWSIILPEGGVVPNKDMEQIEALMQSDPPGPVVSKGMVTLAGEWEDEYAAFLAGLLTGYGGWPPKEPESPRLGVAICPGQGRAGEELGRVLGALDGPSDVMDFMILPRSDTRVPMAKRRDHVRKVVQQQQGYELGILLSDKGDAITVYDRNGDLVPAPHVGAYLSTIALQRYPSASVCTDQTVVFPMLSAALAMGGVLQVGKAHPMTMRMVMSERMCSFGADCEGRYYFRETWWAENAIMAIILLCHMAYLTPKPITEVMTASRAMFAVGEPKGWSVADAESLLPKLAVHMPKDLVRVEPMQDEIICRAKRKPDFRVSLRRTETNRTLVLQVESHGQPGDKNAEAVKLLTDKIANVVDEVVQGRHCT